MVFWQKCPECFGQGSLLAVDYSWIILHLPQACWPVGDQLNTELDDWLSIHHFSKYFKFHNGHYTYKGELIALQCIDCQGRGYIPISNLSPLVMHICSKAFG